MESNIIQGLWIGGKLSNMERLSIQSFLDHGHEYHLYTYDQVKNVPTGAVIKDGNDILPSTEIYRYKNGSVSAFSNLFRFTLLYKKGGYWADTDLVCIRPFKFKDSIIICGEPDNNYSTTPQVGSAFIKLPKGSKVAAEGINIQREHKEKILAGDILWSSGPKTVKQLVETFNLKSYILPWNSICSCAHHHFPSLLEPEYKPNPRIISSISEIPENMVAIHMWNEVWRNNGVDKNGKFHPESIYEILKSTHLKE
jgi:hypothetical protein